MSESENEMMVFEYYRTLRRRIITSVTLLLAALVAITVRHSYTGYNVAIDPQILMQMQETIRQQQEQLKKQAETLQYRNYSLVRAAGNRAVANMNVGTSGSRVKFKTGVYLPEIKARKGKAL